MLGQGDGLPGQHRRGADAGVLSHALGRIVLCVLLLGRALADNVEIWDDEFENMFFENMIIGVGHLKPFNSVKINHMGCSRLDMAKLSPKLLWVYDKAVFLGDRPRLVWRMDYEYKVCGLALFVWPLIGTAIILGPLSYRVCKWMLSRNRRVMDQASCSCFEPVLAEM